MAKSIIMMTDRLGGNSSPKKKSPYVPDLTNQHEYDPAIRNLWRMVLLQALLDYEEGEGYNSWFSSKDAQRICLWSDTSFDKLQLVVKYMDRGVPLDELKEIWQ